MFCHLQLAIPVVPTVKVVITFTKFVELQPVEKFYTPLSSPRHNEISDEDDNPLDKSNNTLTSSTSRSSNMKHKQPGAASQDPFAIPKGYARTSIDDKGSKMKKSKPVRRHK